MISINLDCVFGLILAILFTIYSAVIDAEHITDKDFIEDHRSRFGLRAIFFSALLFIDYRVFILGILFFGSVFDLILNSMCDKDIWYLGDVARWDRFWKKRINLYKAFKYFLFTTFVLLCIIWAIR
jgi:hypothetical protein